MKQVITLLLSLFITNSITAQQYEFSDPNKRYVEDNAAPSGIERFNIHFQGTYIYQYKPAFNSPYDSTNSLSGLEEKQNSLSATMYLGARLWKGAEVYVNPEIVAGSGLSGAVGMAGSSNGEIARIGTQRLTLYLARAYFKQTFALRNKRARKLGYVNKVSLESGNNRLAGYEPKDYLRIYIGKLSLADVFDNNRYSSSPRTQFMNWALMNNGAWDYAANVRGYTGSFVAELQLGKMNYKAAVAMLPTAANGPDLNTDITETLSAVAEVSRSIKINKRPGNIRLLGYYNNANLGNYELASHLTTPNITSTQSFGRTKYGFGLNIDQQLSNTFGAFMRLGWNDGKNETWCFTEIDQTLQLGISANGNKWKRASDNLGLALVLNGISKDHQQYLANGGFGFMLGDGKLSYAPEAIGELYYSFKPIKKGIWITGDYQFCMNPGYNADRGPAHIFSVRVHTEL